MEGSQPQLNQQYPMQPGQIEYQIYCLMQQNELLNRSFSEMFNELNELKKSKDFLMKCVDSHVQCINFLNDNCLPMCNQNREQLRKVENQLSEVEELKSQLAEHLKNELNQLSEINNLKDQLNEKLLKIEEIVKSIETGKEQKVEKKESNNNGGKKNTEEKDNKEKEQTADTCNNLNKYQKHQAEKEKPDMKDMPDKMSGKR